MQITNVMHIHSSDDQSVKLWEDETGVVIHTSDTGFHIRYEELNEFVAVLKAFEVKEAPDAEEGD